MLNIISARFVKSATFPKDFPKHSFSEFAFFGRSNSGKSSLINMILARKNLVKTGAKPGLTQTLNFFAVNESKPASGFYLVDLPGYGYAQVKKDLVQKIDRMLYDYCIFQKQLKIIFLLMDVRRPPSAVEKDITEFFLQNNINFAIVATKCDKVSKSEQLKRQQELADFFAKEKDKIILSSTLKKIGREKILALIQEQL
ncbi:MAG: ribosome biogenesis GTP-binding protein YihA/YsxC [Treponemataceae bacterium]